MLFLRLLLGSDLGDLRIGGSCIVGLEIACSKGNLEDLEKSWVLGMKKKIEDCAGCKVNYFNGEVEDGSFEKSGFVDDDCIFGRSVKNCSELSDLFNQNFGENRFEILGFEDSIGEYHVNMVGLWYIEHLA